MLEVRPVRGRSEFTAFIRLPRLVYADETGFVPPLDFERRTLLDPDKAPFGANGESFRWLAWRNGRPVGRIAAQVDAAAIKAWAEPIGCFGALDAIDDRNVVSALVAAAAAQLSERRMRRMRGPLTPNIHGETGVLVEGQSNGSMLLMPWHPPYLSRHMESAGLSKIKDVLSFSFPRTDAIERIEDALGGAMIQPPNGYRFRQINLKNLLPDIEIVRRIFNEAWANNWGFVPVSAAEAAYLARSLRPIVTIDSLIILEKAREPVAAALAVPNFFEYIADMEGRLAPFNWLRLLWRMRRRRFRSWRVMLFGILPRVNADLIVPTMMFQEMLRRSTRYQFEVCEFGWILEDKTVIVKAFKRNGGVPTTRHRIYEMSLK